MGNIRREYGNQWQTQQDAEEAIHETNHFYFHQKAAKVVRHRNTANFG